MNIERVTKSKCDPGRMYVQEDYALSEENIPVWEVMDVYSFTKLIGHAKHINAKAGSVFYRGQTHIKHIDQAINGFYPSAYRPIKQADDSYICLTQDQKAQIDETIEANISQFLVSSNPTKTDLTIKSFLHCPDSQNASFAIGEAVLQHYGAKTRYLDIVDNHWIALWFASHKYVNNAKCYVPSTDEYCYISLFALPTQRKEITPGVIANSEATIVDLRKACPSTVLRPHMQHGLLFRLNNCIDYAKNVVCIIRIRTDLCLQWIGDTALMREESLFPNSDKDALYRLIQYDQHKAFNKACERIQKTLSSFEKKQEKDCRSELS